MIRITQNSENKANDDLVTKRSEKTMKSDFGNCGFNTHTWRQKTGANLQWEKTFQIITTYAQFMNSG